jgi:hypothetical protein
MQIYSSSGSCSSSSSNEDFQCCAKRATFREFLDKTQYTEDNIQTYEWIYGRNFTTPGKRTNMPLDFIFFDQFYVFMLYFFDFLYKFS